MYPLHHKLKGLDFDKRNRYRSSFQREHILEWRRSYLRAIDKHRAEKWKLYYQDEICTNAGRIVDMIRTDTTGKSASQTHLSALIIGLKTTSEKKAKE